MAKRYKGDEKRAAVRCVDCPACGAPTGDECHYIGFDPSVYTVSNVVPTHKRRVDKFYSRPVEDFTHDRE